MKTCFVFFFLLILLTEILSRKSDLLKLNGEDDNVNICGKNGHVIVATAEGNITAIDIDSGKKCWTTTFDNEPFISSSLSKLEVWENNTRVLLIPSLEGIIYKYDTHKLERLPFDADSFLDGKTNFDDSTFVSGGKFKVVNGVHRLTGKILYQCSFDDCNRFEDFSSEHIILVQQLIQIINAIDSTTGKLRWHFRVVEIEIKALNLQKNHQHIKHKVKQFSNSNENALLSLNHQSSSLPWNSIKISLAGGYTARLNKSFNFCWVFKAEVPITDVWAVDDMQAVLLDPFRDESSFFSIDSKDGKHTSLLFLGSYKDQLFVKQSRKLKDKMGTKYDIMRNTHPKAYCFPLDSVQTDNSPVFQRVIETSSNAVIPEYLDYDDVGFYFYANFTVLNNDTHCNVRFEDEDLCRYNLQREEYLNKNMKIYFWLKVLEYASLFTFIIVPALYIAVVRYIRLKAKEPPVVVALSEGTSNEIMTTKKAADFISRFQDEFEFVATLGKGGFGVVMEAQNKFDGCKYAVKRIRIRTDERHKDEYDHVMREVKALAQLDHPAVVRYFNSWIEHPPIGWQEIKDDSFNISDVHQTTTAEEPSLPRNHFDNFSTNLPNQNPKKVVSFRIADKLRVNPLNQIQNGINFSFNEQSSKFSDWSSSSDNSTFSRNYIPPLMSHSNLNSNTFMSSENTRGIDMFSNRKYNYERSKFSNDLHINQKKLVELESSTSVSVDNPVDFHCLIKVNNLLVKQMKMPFLKRFSKYILSYGRNGTFLWSKWSCTIADDRKVMDNLYLLRNWLISVMCVVQLNELYYSERIASSNICNILYEVNSILDTDISENETNSEAFCRLKIINDSLSYPMKFTYLTKLRHFLFCKEHFTKRNLCHHSSWRLIFYRENGIVYQKNLDTFLIWIISMLCELSCHYLQKIFQVTTMNLCHILSDIQEENDTSNISSTESCEIPENSSQGAFDMSELLIFHNCDAPKFPKVLPYLEEKPGFLYIQMQLCKKDSLRSWLNMAKERSYFEVMKIFLQIIEGINYIHNRGLMHRDLKPSNIYFSLEGNVKIGDFGLATHFEYPTILNGSPSSSSSSHTQHCGTKLYMSPEQRSNHRYTYKTDIYPLGIILFELLVPFSTQSERFQTISALRKLQFPDAFMSTYLNESLLILKLMDKDPERRPSTKEILNHPLFQAYI